jgi:TM2 domain-containing membrane protein YozV
MPVTLNVKAGLIAGFISTVVLSIFMIAKSSVGLLPQLNPIEDIVHVADRLTGMTLPLPFGWIGHFVLGTVVWGIIYAALQASLPGIANRRP